MKTEMAYPVNTIDGYLQQGLTKRELFAAMAMQGFNSNSDTRLCDSTHGKISLLSVQQADQLIAELSK